MVMKLLSSSLSALALLVVALVSSSAHAQWGYYRVTSSYSLPSVPYAFQPVVVPAVQPTTVLSPVVMNQPVAVTQPAIVGSPVVVGRPIVVGQPFVPSAVVVRRGLFRRPVIVGTAPAGVVVPAAYPATSFAAPVTVSAGFAPAPVVVQRPVWVVP
jgi:hypothetical protein